MTVYIEKDGDEEAWAVECAPGCLTDILIVARRNCDEEASFSFKLGELMAEEIENWGDWMGMLKVDDNHFVVLSRWADQLEIYASLMRSALRSRRDMTKNPRTAEDED